MRLSGLNIYPVKSLKGISLRESRVERRGLENDRRWLLVDENNKFLTQREFPKMATIAVETTPEGLRLSADGNSFDVTKTPRGEQSRRVRIWSQECRALDYGDEVNAWLSENLGFSCRLVAMPDETIRRVSHFYAVHKDDHVSFADGYPFLLIGEASLDDLNGRLDSPVPMNRFRPNIVIAGAEPSAEDSWKKIRIGSTVFHNVKPCARCVITTIDQSLGEKQGTEPLKTLATFRIPKRSVKKKILFGQNLIAETAGGVLRIGDDVEILEYKRPPKFS